MRYTVIWLPGALNDLARLWLDSERRDAISRASAALDHALVTAPLDHGESREEEMRVLLCDPLGVEYKVNEGDRRVVVTSVWIRLS